MIRQDTTKPRPFLTHFQSTGAGPAWSWATKAFRVERQGQIVSGVACFCMHVTDFGIPDCVVVISSTEFIYKIQVNLKGIHTPL
jgi:hypothetical protein